MRADWAGIMESVNGGFTVRITGEIDVNGAARFRQYLLGAVSMAHEQVRIDLRGVRDLDSSALSALVAASDAAERRVLRFEVDADGVALRVIELAGLSFLLRSFPELAT